jgi:hypothetical protein
VVNIEKRLTRDGYDSRFSNLQLSAGSHAKRELWVRPTENNFAKLTPFLCGLPVSQLQRSLACRVYDEAGNVIETHEHKGELKEW